MKMDLPAPVLHSLFALTEAGFEAYVVGGCVRDSLMGKEPFDWDITTSALPEQMQNVFADHRTIETGIQHGTLTVILDDQPLEITTYRVDGEYTDGRHPDAVSFTRSLTEDLRRRDYTVNAIAYHPDKGIMDPFGGLQDVSNGIVRAVGNPETRFTEDSLRILRGLRFSATLGFSIESATSSAIHKLSPTLNRVSAERITTELTKLLCGQNAGAILTEYADIFGIILPCQPNFGKVAQYISNTEPHPLHRYTALFWGLTPNEIIITCEKLRFSRRLTEDLQTISRFKKLPVSQNTPDVLRLLHHLGSELTQVMLCVRGLYDRADYTDVQRLAKALVEQNACFRVADLAVNGADLLAYGMQPGPNIGNALSLLLEAVMDGKCPNHREKLLSYAKEKSLC